MGEYSMFWDDCEVGDARLAPYSAKMYRSLWNRALVADDERFCAFAGTLDDTGLKVSIDDAATTVTVSQGAAIIDGVFYWTDGVTFSVARPSSGYYAYTVVLRKTQSAKTVVLALLGPLPYTTDVTLRSGGYPVPTQTDEIFEVPIAYVTTKYTGTGFGTRAAHDTLYRLGSNHCQMPAHFIHTVPSGGYPQGWTNPCTGAGFWYDTKQVFCQVGVYRWTGGAATSGNATVWYPYQFAYYPIVFIQPVEAWVLASANNIGIQTFDLHWQSMNATTYTSRDFFWIAFGEGFAFQ